MWAVIWYCYNELQWEVQRWFSKKEEAEIFLEVSCFILDDFDQCRIVEWLPNESEVKI